MKIYIKDNNVLQYEDKLEHVDVEMDGIDDIDVKKRHVYLGENGVGKTFDFRMFVNTAYLYSINDHSPNNDYDTQRVMQNMVDVGVGTLNETHRSNDYYLIKHFASFHSEEDQNAPLQMQSGSDDVNEALLAGAKLLKKLDSSFYLKIGPSAKQFFDQYNVIYFSNSQFPSNDMFFSKRASSFRADDVDPIFWMTFRNIPEKEFYKIRLWKNNSMSLLGSKSLEEIFSTISSERFLSDVRYKYRKIFNYINFDLQEVFDNAPIMKTIQSFYTEGEKFPGCEIPLNSLGVYDYIVMLLFKEADATVNYELYNIEDGKEAPYSKLNSGKKYLLALKCLKHVYAGSSQQTVIIVDEPENSLHLNSLQEIVGSEDGGCIFWVATHSPAYAMSLIKNEIEGEEDDDEDDVVLHIASKKEGLLREEICSKELLASLSLDSIAAELFSYSPFLEKFERLNQNIDASNMISIDEFYRQLNDL